MHSERRRARSSFVQAVCGTSRRALSQRLPGSAIAAIVRVNMFFLSLHVCAVSVE
jgi:hypothetical protein